ncbi:MAG: type III-A CRISPR-associated RAMP protein Csm4 [Bacteroidetes bacterium]|nr:MAG: type III-A CRISPR-associated RAMP protein Csm4 [Bacteroidota bacterium]
MQVLYLIPQSPYRTRLRSDTVWGLLVTAIGQVYGERRLLDVVEAAEAGEPFFTVSSAMPFYDTEDGQRVHCFPRPITAPYTPPPTDLAALQRIKRAKKVHWLPQPEFEAWLQGRQGEAKLLETTATRVAVGPRATYTEHIAIDRLTGTTRAENGSGQLFTRTNYYLPGGGGLFVLVRGQTELLEGAVRFLEHFGFGGDNTVGRGHFRTAWGTLKLAEPETPTHAITLSLYAPTRAELEGIRQHRNACWYDLEIRRGRVGTHFVGAGVYRKRPVAVFREGSSFPALPQRLQGRVQVVLELGDRRIRHSGLAFPVAARLAD